MWAEVVLVNGRAEVITEQVFPVPTWYGRAATTASGLWVAIAQGPNTVEIVNAQGVRKSWPGIAFGMSPVAIQIDGETVHAYWVNVGGFSYSRLRLDAKTLTPQVYAPTESGRPTGTSQGIAVIGTDGRPVFWDDVPGVIEGEHKLTLPVAQGDYLLGQANDRVGLKLLRRSTGQVFVVTETATQAPSRLVIEADGTPVVAIGEGSHEVCRGPFPAWTRPVAPLPDPLHRPLWVGFFEYPGLMPTVPANARVIAQPNQPWLNVTALSGETLFRYVAAAEDSNRDQLQAAIQAASGSLTPVGAYWTRQAQQQGSVPEAAIVCVEAYQGREETDAAFIWRVREAVRQVARHGRRPWLIAQCYTSNTKLTAELTHLPGLYTTILAQEPAIEGVLIFNAGLRSPQDVYGWNHHPEVRPYWQALVDGISTPVLHSVVEPPAPLDPPPSSSEPPVTTRTVAFRYSNTLYLTAELGAEDNGRLVARGTQIGPWERFTIYLLGSKWAEGEKVLIAAADGRFVNAAVGGIAGYDMPVAAVLRDSAQIFTIRPGESAGTWALTHGGIPLTAEFGFPGENILRRRPEPTPIQSYESVTLIDADTGAVIPGPF